MRTTTGVAEIDASIAKLQRLDDLANQFFRKRVTIESYRKQVVETIAGMSELELRMYSAPHVDEDMLAPIDEDNTLAN